MQVNIKRKLINLGIGFAFFALLVIVMEVVWNTVFMQSEYEALGLPRMSQSARQLLIVTSFVFILICSALKGWHNARKVSLENKLTYLVLYSLGIALLAFGTGYIIGLMGYLSNPYQVDSVFDLAVGGVMIVVPSVAIGFLLYLFSLVIYQISIQEQAALK